jgi:hypothetical protein
VANNNELVTLLERLQMTLVDCGYFSNPANDWPIITPNGNGFAFCNRNILAFCPDKSTPYKITPIRWPWR